MKKSLILSILFSSFYCYVFAQANSSSTKNDTHIPHKIEYGFLSGVNFNKIRLQGVNSYLKEYVTNYTGVSVGGYFKVNITEQFGIKALVQYDQNGYRLGELTFTDSNGFPLTTGNVTIKINYLNFPIVGEFRFGNKIKYYINAGPYIGFVLSSNIVIKIRSTNTTPEDISKEKTNSYKSTNMGASFGAGTQIPISKKIQLHVAVKNNIGLSNIIKPIPTDSSPYKTNTFSILAGINIGL